MPKGQHTSVVGGVTCLCKRPQKSGVCGCTSYYILASDAVLLMRRRKQCVVNAYERVLAYTPLPRRAQLPLTCGRVKF